METGHLVQTVVKVNTPPSPVVSVPSGDVVSQQEVKPTGNILPNAAEENALKQKVEDRPSAQAVEAKVKDLNSFVQNIQRGIEFSVHEETGRHVVIVTDIETGKEIRKFPSDEVLAISTRIAETLAVPDDRALGLLVSESA